MGEGTAFEHRTMAQRVLFGSGAAAAHLREEVRRRGAPRVMAIVTLSAAEAGRRLLDGVAVVAWFDGAAQHVPVETAEWARALAGASGADLLVCVGGGSAIGVAKAVAPTTSLPIVAVPTTYSGSEATPV
ncbi:MAG: iron-containing alcohol dehydrogenase, partial [Actinomycetes bacterium]|nr:iron-containing alcohol dehydrogenase [Actinomycetes bacterium]MDX5380650.1 iron-containing alcohol dehydrogenase [Actinomycetes bacterium]MDX5399602.1 iron-containing alcohol dehydrogenase [Actinomycetes bacterium]MDX5450392.1 iron-containing alcohol dehydrogenase [Actinomycetes bacterium]